MKLVDELIEYDTAFAEAHQGEVCLVQVETLAPPEKIVDVGIAGTSARYR